MPGARWSPRASRTADRELAIPADDHHMEGMAMRSPGSGSFNTSQAMALERWEAEGGAFGAPSRERPESQSPLSDQETQILQYLGAAVLSKWNGLPTHIQHELFENSFGGGTAHETAQLKRRIAQFLHRHKDDIASPH